MIKDVLSLFMAGWKSLSAFGSILMLLWFWPDIRDLPEAYGYKWGQILPDRETLAFGLLVLALLWIVWMDTRRAIIRWWRGRSAPLRIKFSDGSIEHWWEGNTSYNRIGLCVQNTSPRKSLDDVEIHLLMLRHDGAAVTYVQRRLRERHTGEVRFHLFPKMERMVLLGKKAIEFDDADVHNALVEFGPFEGGEEYIPLPPGLYKVEVVAYGRNIEPVREDLAVAVHQHGMLSLGPWREDLEWPLKAEVKISGDRVLQRPQDTE